MVSKWILRCLPRGSRSKLRCLGILENDLGHAASRCRRECCDRAGNPIPWYTYPALEYIRQIDWTEKNVFEFGSGNSTRFWSAQANQVTAVEHDGNWFKQVKDRVGSNVSLHLMSDGNEYVHFLSQQANKFDLIVVDGEFRAACAEQALAMVADDGAILLDNSDWHPEAAEILRANDLLEVDFTGFGPINDYTWSTSLFFKRTFRPNFRSSRHPLPGLGAINNRATIHRPQPRVAA